MDVSKDQKQGKQVQVQTKANPEKQTLKDANNNPPANSKTSETQSLPANLGQVLQNSPRKTRIDEKNVLAGLNNRLAAIIEKNHQLEQDNSSLTNELQIEKENTSLTVTKMRVTYNKELEDTRKTLENIEKDKVKSDLHANQLQKALNDTKQKLDAKTVDASDLEKKLANADGEIGKLASELKKTNEAKDKLAKEKKDLENDKVTAAKELDALQKKLEAECLAKIELQSKVKGQVDEFNITIEKLNQDIVNFKRVRNDDLTEMDGKLKKEYELKLQENMEKLRQEYEKQLLDNKESQAKLYNAKEMDLKGQLSKANEATQAKVKEIDGMTTKLDDANKKVTTLEGEKYGLLQNQKELKKKHDESVDRLTKEKAEKEKTIEEVRNEKNLLIREYQDLWDIKVELDNELAMYQNLLEGEEQRLNLSTDSSAKQESTKEKAKA